MNKYIVTLTADEQAQLRHIIATRSSKAAVVKRAFVLLSVDTKAPGPRFSDEQIRWPYHVAQRAIERLRQRFVEEDIVPAFYAPCRRQFTEFAVA